MPDATDPHADTIAPGQAEVGKKKRSVGSGDTLGRYELSDEVGEGGMATVYRARDTELRRDVAIKVLFPHLAKRTEVVRRFHREARAAAGLEHANILRIYDVGGDVESDDPPFIVMELVRGTTLLGEIEQRGPMFAEVIACVGALLADALGAAHAAGIIHRDIKPANVLVAPGGRLLLADFGVARLETEDSLVTKTGALLGTPAYMSPEQASGDIATAKSDLYSLGATLYQLATGSLPYPGSPAKVMASIAAGPPIAAVKKRAEVGPELSRLIEQMMQHEPDARPASAVAVAGELRRIAEVLGDPADVLEAYFADPAAYVARQIPAVVKRVVAQGRAAITEGKLPRALAFADRAQSLAPDDPDVTALVTAVTEGERGGARRRILAIGLVGAAVIGGGVAASVKLFGGTPAAADAGVRPIIEPPRPTPDAIELVAIDAANLPDAIVADARTTRARDAARPLAIEPDAALVDASIVIVPDAAEAQTGTIVISNDAWCDLAIDRSQLDHQAHAFTKELTVPVGHHTVTCAQTGTSHTWTRDLEVGPGQRVPASGSMLGTITVTFEIAATLDGTAFAKGQTTRHAPGSVELEVGGQRKYVTLSRDCVVRPPVRCDPP